MLQNLNVSDNSLQLIMASWSQGTKKQYNTYAKRWMEFCTMNKVSATDANVEQAIEFLTELYQKDLSFSAINTARSMLSVILKPVDGMTIGNQPLMRRFMKGVFRSRPSLPKYTVTYDVNIVLQYLGNLPTCQDLSLKQLTERLVTLLALLSGQRCQTLQFLNLNCMLRQEDRYTFYIASLLKTTRPAFHQMPLEFLAYPHNQKLCVVRNLDEYITRTQGLRNGCFQLLISPSKPYKGVKSSTIGRWLRKVLADAGIDTKTFAAHSTRSASTSCAKAKGLSVMEIARAAGWKNCRTFAEHYDKLAESNFGNAILELTK